MKRILHIIAILAAVISSMTACKKEIDIDYKDIAPLTVIEGRLTQEGATIRISLTTPMDEPMDTTAITDAIVTLTDMTDGRTISLLPDCSGNYVSDEAGIPGHRYSLDVTRQNRSYRSESTMTLPTEIDTVELNWIRMPYDDVAIVKVRFNDTDSATGSCYWVRLYRNGEAYMWNLVTDMQADASGLIDNLFMTSRRDLNEEDEATALRDGDILTATVTPIDRTMYDYLEALSADSNGPSLFAGDFCLGYFLAAPVASDTVTFHPAEIPYF